jgi:hypothetical protein
MARNAKLLTLGLLGGASTMYESIMDDLSADSGRWLDGALAPAAITIDTGRAIWTPTEGAELHTSANAASDPNSNEANATTGWAATGTTLSVESTDVNTGSYALKAVAADGTSDRISWSRTNASRKWYVMRCAVKVVSGTKWEVQESYGFPVVARLLATADWANYVLTAKKSANYSEVGVWSVTGGSASDTVLADNISIKELNPDSQFRIQRIYYPSSIAANVWMSGATPLGVVAYQDANNWVLAVAGRSLTTFSITLMKSVGGVVSLVGSAVTTIYSAGALLELIPAADFQTWTVKYNTAVRINAAAITDFAATGTWYAGMLNTHNPSDITAASFDDFAVARLEGAPLFAYARVATPSLTVLDTSAIVTSAGEPNWFGRPTVAVLGTGVVVMVYKRNAGHDNDGSGTLHIRFSDDYGATWTNEDTDLNAASVAAFPVTSDTWTGLEDVTEPLLYLAPDGTLLLHFWRYDWTAITGDGSYQMTSSDGGITWSAPASIGLTGSTDATRTFTTDDRTVIGTTIYAGCSFKGAGAGKEGIVKSEDNGATWAYVANVVASGSSEIGVERVGANALIAVLRGSTNIGASVSRSADAGATWSTAVGIGHIIGDSGRHRLSTAAHLKGEADWWTDPRLMMWGYAYEGANRRSCVWLSVDSGVNWSAPHYVDTAYSDAGYGDVFYNPSTGNYIFLCYRGTATQADIVQYTLSINWDV